MGFGMNKATRIAAAILVSLVIGGMNVHNDSVNMTPGYQAHPVVTIIANFFWAGLVTGSIVYFGSGWLTKRKERNAKKAHNSSRDDVPSGKADDKFYDEVARELQEKSMIPGLWTKAFAEMDGDDAKARALYIKYRVAQLAEAGQRQLKEDELQKKKREVQRRSDMEAAERRARSGLHRFIYAILTFFWGVVTLSCTIIGGVSIGLPFTQNSGSSDDFILAFTFGPIFLLIAFFFGSATRSCYRETQ
jgi:uncharacterized membrane protein YciS (DUF1049 family)